MKSFAFIAMLALLFSCAYINGKLNQEDDWYGEEIVEEVIKAKTGIDIDLTPESPE